MYYPEGFLQKTQPPLTEAVLREAKEKQSILEATATVCDSQHNLWVDLPCGKGVIPREEGAIGMDTGAVRDIALIARVGRPVCFTVQEQRRRPDGESLYILSRKNAQLKCRQEMLDGCRSGDVLTARVTHLEPFGAFCDIGCGIASLLPIDCISVSRISHPSHRLAVGQRLPVVVKEKLPDGKINLTHKELLGTWEENAALFAPGETVTGIVRTVESYGSFVELTPNLAGLAEPKEGVQAGQQAAVFIKSLIPEKMKVKLIIVDAFEGVPAVSPPRYFTNGQHIDYWRYSPDVCPKIMETIFDE